MIQSILALLCLQVAILILAPPRAGAQENPAGPAYMFITYRCAPADRPRVLDASGGGMAGRFAELKRSGAIADYLLLFNCYVDATTWDVMAIVRFDSLAQSAGWQRVERTSPGGLTADQLKILTPLNTYFADRHWAKGTMGDQSKAIYMAIPYHYVEKGLYINYLDVYGIPQFNAWLDKKVINRYEIFLNMYATGAPWDAFILFEYADASALARRDEVKQSVRAGLVKDPGWKMLQQSKQEYRTEAEVVVATALAGLGR